MTVADIVRKWSSALGRAVFLMVVVLGAACAEEGADDLGRAPGTSASDELAQPPSAGAPRASQPGFAPDTVRPGGAGDDTLAGLGAAPSTSHLSLDSIVGRYRNNYAAEYVEITTEGGGATQAEIEEAARRRTALDFGYVELNAWADMVADLTVAQRAELAQRIEQANRELARELQREDSGAER